MTDRELIELAAKAADMSLEDEAFGLLDWWNPLTDDGDALRLAVKLGLALSTSAPCTACGIDTAEEVGNAAIEYHADSDPYAATRRAIVRAAAAIGEGKP